MPKEIINIINTAYETTTDYLNLSFLGKIENTEIQKLLKLTKLRHLNASNTDLLDKHLETIGQIYSLELLDLDSTEITNNGLKFLENLKQLKELRLKDNPQLTDDSITYISNIELLELIHIENTSITIDGLKTLLNRKKLKEVILDSDESINELIEITKEHRGLKIILKGTGIISNDNLNS